MSTVGSFVSLDIYARLTFRHVMLSLPPSFPKSDALAAPSCWPYHPFSECSFHEARDAKCSTSLNARRVWRFKRDEDPTSLNVQWGVRSDRDKMSNVSEYPTCLKVDDWLFRLVGYSGLFDNHTRNLFAIHFSPISDAPACPSHWPFDAFSVCSFDESCQTKRPTSLYIKRDRSFSRAGMSNEPVQHVWMFTIESSVALDIQARWTYWHGIVGNSPIISVS